jgi:hypothetical protein
MQAASIPNTGDNCSCGATNGGGERMNRHRVLPEPHRQRSIAMPPRRRENAA